MHVTDWAPAQKGRPSYNCHVELARGPEEDQSEDTPGRACFQQREPHSVEESSKFFDSPEHPLLMLYTQMVE